MHPTDQIEHPDTSALRLIATKLANQEVNFARLAGKVQALQHQANQVDLGNVKAVDGSEEQTLGYVVPEDTMRQIGEIIAAVHTLG